MTEIHDDPIRTAEAVSKPPRAGRDQDDREGHAAPGFRFAKAISLLAMILTIFAQAFAARFDHQNANLVGLISFAIAILVILFSLQRRLRWSGHPYWLPACCIGILGIAVTLFQFEGFSGEMMPEFGWRFGGAASRPLQTESVAVAPSSLEPSDLADASGEIKDSLKKEASLSLQFLGPNRNGVIDNRAFDLPKGSQKVEVLWDQGIGPGWSSFAVDEDLAITTEQRDDQECLAAYRLLDGALVWIRKHLGRHENALGGVGPRSTPAVVGDRVFATTATGFLWCVDRLSGQEIWTVDLLELAGWDSLDAFESDVPWGYSASPLVVDGLCIVPLGGPDSGVDGSQPGPALVALDVVTGEVVWQSGNDQLSYASPVLMTLAGQKQIVSVNEATVSGHSIDDGQQRWSFSWPGSTTTNATCPSAVPVDGNHLLVGKGYGGGSALVEIRRDGQRWEATDVWRSHRVLKTKFNHTCVLGGVGYAISNGSLQAVRLSDGAAFWTQPRRNRAEQGQVLLVEDTLVVQEERGDVVFAEATTDGYNELLRLPALDSKTWNVPTVAGRFLLVRNDRQAICYRLPPRTQARKP